MDRPYVDQLRVINYRCVKDATVELTPLHALIGPNDSGKSTLLQAFARSAAWSPIGEATVVGARVGGRRGVLAHTAHCVPAAIDVRQPNSTLAKASTPLNAPENADLHRALSGARMLRLDPDALREPASLIAGRNPIWFESERGSGLAGVYDAVLSRNVGAFLELSQRFAQLFPTAKNIELTNPDGRRKAIGAVLVDGQSISASEMSEGMLYWLAFAVLTHCAASSILLVEEPENGLHPSRIAEVVRVLREVSKTTQVVIATHSPLVINELKPEEVTLITRTPEAGTIATPMTKTKNFAERSKIYALGELWLSYADGDFESELVGESTAKAKSAS